MKRVRVPKTNAEWAACRTKALCQIAQNKAEEGDLGFAIYSLAKAVENLSEQIELQHKEFKK